MTYLVDANVLSEATKARPLARVLDWLRANEREIVVDPFTLGEIRFGIYLMPAGARRRQLEQAATGLRWARLLAELRAAGQSMPIKDSLIATTALTHGLTLVTHNQRDFRNAPVKIFDPFVEV